MKIHKTRHDYNQGWTMCHKGIFALRTDKWEKVTCKQCLRELNKNKKEE